MGNTGGMSPTTLPGDAAARLRSIVGDAHVLDDPEVTAGYTQDWTGRVRGSTAAVVRPRTTDEVAAVLRTCSELGVAVVPQGGNTGLVGGSVAFDGAVTLSSTRLDEVGSVDALTGQVDAGAGVPLVALQAAAQRAGLRFGVDLAARDSATVGGMVATNAGGLHVVRHGPMRAQLTGITAVRSTGDVIGDVRGLLKDNTGYHWPSILCGSEGTLAIITDVRVQLVAPVEDVAVALFAFDDATAAVEAAAIARRDFADVHAIELVTESGIELVCDALSIPPPFPQPAPFVLLVEGAGPPGVVDRLAQVADSLPAVRDSAVAIDPEPRTALWRYREAHTESIARLGPVHKLDVTLPLPALAEFLRDVRPAVTERRPHASVWLFGHAGDGNVHVNITGIDADDDAVDELVLRLVAARGGSISAEHGIGRAKLAHLHLNRTDAEIRAMRDVKRALDPAGILNPGVLIPG
jgi:FAD/FMN-containing dehydrogenase